VSLELIGPLDAFEYNNFIAQTIYFILDSATRINCLIIILMQSKYFHTPKHFILSQGVLRERD
jgi:hypothetical protein